MKPIIYATIWILMATIALAIPPIPNEYYGVIEINGKLAPAKTNVTILDNNEIMCGTQFTKEEGKYGLLSCRGDDPQTEIDEGPNNGELVTLYVNNIKYKEIEWQSGRFTNQSIDITIKTNFAHILPKISKIDIAFIALMFLTLSTLIWVIFESKEREIE